MATMGPGDALDSPCSVGNPERGPSDCGTTRRDVELESGPSGIASEGEVVCDLYFLLPRRSRDLIVIGDACDGDNILGLQS